MTPDLLEVFQSMDFSNKDEGITLNDRVLIIDGMNTFIRSFAAIPTMDENGNHIGGVTGFLKSVGYVIRKFKPSRVYVIFDGKGGSKRRRDIYPDYKSGRKPLTRLNRTYDMTTEQDEQDLMRYELVIVAKALMKLPITTITLDYVEADDIISYIAQHVVENGGESIIYSTDKDFLQLVGDGIKVWNPVRKKTYIPETVLEDYTIHPNNFLLYRALTGDISDNLPGIKGLGMKTLLKFMPGFATEEKLDLDDVITIAESSKSKVMLKIVDQKENIQRNLILMSLLSVMMSDNNKLKVLNKINKPQLFLKKYDLTKLLIETNILPSMQNYDSWVVSTFNSLTRFDG
jgi:DNA polymerase-1